MFLIFIFLVAIFIRNYAVAYDYSDGLWRKSLKVCWTDPTCIRKLTISHGGDWNVTLPYDSIGAFEKAYDIGADVVKGDFRVSKDNIGMVMHSSPILIYESFDCFHKKVEEHTAEQNSACHMIYTNYTFNTVPEVLKWSENKINFMFCVKETADIPRAITTLIENHAVNRAFLEISVNEILDIVVNNSEGWEEVYYIINMGNIDEFNRMISSPSNVLQRTILFEFNDWESWPSSDLQTCMTNAHNAGIKTVGTSNSNPITSTVKNHLDIYNHGFDVAYTYNLDNAIEARKIMNTENHIFPA